MLVTPAHKSGIWLQILGLTAGMHSYTSETSIAAKILRNPVGRCTSVLVPLKQAFQVSTVFDPPQKHDRDATEPHVRPNVYLADVLPREPSRIVRGQREQTVAWPKHGGASCSHETFLHAASRAVQSPEIYYRSLDHPNAHELTIHIRHPSSAPGLRSPGAPGKVLRMRCGTVPVSPTGTTGSLPRIL
jgi:hypothetical protein